MPEEQTTPPPTTQENTPPSTSETTPPATTSTSDSTDLGTETPKDEVKSDDLGDLGSDEPKKEETPPAPKYFGVLEEGKDYEAFTLPEGSTANPELQASFSEVAKDLGLNQEGAQKLVNYKTELDKAQVKQWGEHLTSLRTASMADPEIGGAKYNESVSLGRKVIEKFGGKDGGAELRSVMKNYGVGAHPAMIRFMAAVGRAVGETPTGGTGGSGGSVKDKPLHELFYGDSSKP